MYSKNLRNAVVVIITPTTAYHPHPGCRWSFHTHLEYGSLTCTCRTRVAHKCAIVDPRLAFMAFLYTCRLPTIGNCLHNRPSPRPAQDINASSTDFPTTSPEDLHDCSRRAAVPTSYLTCSSAPLGDAVTRQHS